MIRLCKCHRHHHHQSPDNMRPCSKIVSSSTKRVRTALFTASKPVVLRMIFLIRSCRRTQINPVLLGKFSMEMLCLVPLRSSPCMPNIEGTHSILQNTNPDKHSNQMQHRTRQTRNTMENHGKRSEPKPSFKIVQTSILQRDEYTKSPAPPTGAENLGRATGQLASSPRKSLLLCRGG